MKSGAGETSEEEVEMIGTDAAVVGCVTQANFRVSVTLLDECPKPLESTGVATPPSNLR